MNRRNPRLVPYNLLDEKTKKTNRDTVCSAVRTLIGYGYNIEPPDQESSKFYKPDAFNVCLSTIEHIKITLKVNVYAIFEVFLVFVQVRMDRAAPVETKSEFSEQRNLMLSHRGNGTLSLKL